MVIIVDLSLPLSVLLLCIVNFYMYHSSLQNSSSYPGSRAIRITAQHQDISKLLHTLPPNNTPPSYIEFQDTCFLSSGLVAVAVFQKEVFSLKS